MNSLVDVAWRVDAVLSSGGSSGKSNKESGSEPTTIGSGSAEAMDAAAGNSNKVGSPLSCDSQAQVIPVISPVLDRVIPQQQALPFCCVALSRLTSLTISTSSLIQVVHLKFTVDPLPQRSSGAAVDGIPEKVAPSVPAVTEEVPVAMSADKFAVLFLELKRAKAQMAAIE